VATIDETVSSVRAGAPQLQLTQDGGEHAGRHTLVLEGELDMAWAPVLDTAVQRVCDSGVPALALDLRRLTFMDSAGLRSILLASEMCEQHGCTFLLIEGPPQIQRLFEVTGLLDRLPFERASEVPTPPSDADHD